MQGIIDLKRKKEETQSVFSDNVSQLRKVQDADFWSYKWVGREYEKKEQTRGWKIGMGAFLAVLLILAALAQNYLFIAFLALAAVTFVLFSRREPQEVSCAIGAKGITVSGRMYAFSEFASFWIFEAPGGRELSLETKKIASSYLKIPLGDADTDEIKRILLARLPEKEHAESATDQIARAFGF